VLADVRGGKFTQNAFPVKQFIVLYVPNAEIHFLHMATKNGSTVHMRAISSRDTERR